MCLCFFKYDNQTCNILEKSKFNITYKERDGIILDNYCDNRKSISKSPFQFIFRNFMKNGFFERLWGGGRGGRVQDQHCLC